MVEMITTQISALYKTGALFSTHNGTMFLKATTHNRKTPAATFTSFQNSLTVLCFLEGCDFGVWAFGTGAAGGGGGAIGGGGGGAPGTGGGGGGGGGPDPDGALIVGGGAVNFEMMSTSSADVRSVKSKSETFNDCCQTYKLSRWIFT